jgi:hypothetical protein
VHKKGPKVVATPTDVRNAPMVLPLFPGGARSCVIVRTVGAKAARVRAWKILIG